MEESSAFIAAFIACSSTGEGIERHAEQSNTTVNRKKKKKQLYFIFFAFSTNYTT